MKAKLVFDLSSPEDVEEFEVYNKVHQYAAALGEMRNWLRDRVKYGEDKGEDLQSAYTKLSEICEDYKIDFWEDI